MDYESWAFIVFKWAGAVFAAGLMVGCAAAAVMFALNRVLCVMSCLEAAMEAKKQGRAPILRAYRSIFGRD